jgi:hypothetical protein
MFKWKDGNCFENGLELGGDLGKNNPILIEEKEIVHNLTKREYFISIKNQFR